jgi:poly(3-hydroxybutyrate) depolymerase
MLGAMAWLTRRAASVVLAAAVATAAGCADDGSGGAPYDVTVEVVSDESTQDVRVHAPDAEGPWPVVVALHGIDGTAEDVDGLASRLAAEASWSSPPATAPASGPRRQPSRW